MGGGDHIKGKNTKLPVTVRVRPRKLLVRDGVL